MPNKHAPYSLLTEHGRAQSYAYSQQGAHIASAIETSMLATLEEVSVDLEKLIHNGTEDIATDSRADSDLYNQLEVFRSELGKRDEAVFKLLLQDYKTERDFRNENFDRLLKLVEDIRLMFNI